MPFVIVKRGSEYCVFTQSKPGGGPKGSPHGCHPTRDKALAQMRALYASVPDARMSAEACCPTCADGEFAAAFSLPAFAVTTAGEFVVYPNSRLFLAGEYPDKNFSASLEDLAALLDTDAPVPIQVEHTDSVFDGKLGDVRPTGVDAEGWLIGETRIPAWLDSLLGPDERQLSSVFDRETKALRAVGLVLSPRVTGAAMMAAFNAAQPATLRRTGMPICHVPWDGTDEEKAAYLTRVQQAVAEFARRHDTPHGQHAMQAIHDHAASLGAVCSPGNANMASRHEHGAIQSIHDTAVQHGAACAALGNVRQVTALYSDPSGGGKETRMSEEKTGAPGWLQGFRDWLDKAGEKPTAGTPAPTATTADFAAERATLTAERDAALAAQKTASEQLGKALEAERARYVTAAVGLGIPETIAKATAGATAEFSALKTLADEAQAAKVARFGRGPSANVTAATDDGAGADENPALAAALASAKKTGAAERARNGK